MPPAPTVPFIFRYNIFTDGEPNDRLRFEHSIRTLASAYNLAAMTVPLCHCVLRGLAAHSALLRTAATTPAPTTATGCTAFQRFQPPPPTPPSAGDLAHGRGQCC